MRYLIASLILNTALLSSYFYVRDHKLQAPKLLCVRVKQIVRKTVARVTDEPLKILEEKQLIPPPATIVKSDAKVQNEKPKNLKTILVAKKKPILKKKRGKIRRAKNIKKRIYKLSSTQKSPAKKIIRKKKSLLTSKRMSSFIKKKKKRPVKALVKAKVTRRKISIKELLSSLKNTDFAPMPSYTKEATWDELEGDVLVDYDVLPNGTVVLVKLNNKSGYSHLADIVSKKVNTWKLPSQASTRRQVTFEFRLRN